MIASRHLEKQEGVTKRRSGRPPSPHSSMTGPKTSSLAPSRANDERVGEAGADPDVQSGSSSGDPRDARRGSGWWTLLS